MCSESPVTRGAAHPENAQGRYRCCSWMSRVLVLEGLHFVLMGRRMEQVNGELRVRQEAEPWGLCTLGLPPPRLHASHMRGASTASPSEAVPRVRSKETWGGV